MVGEGQTFLFLFLHNVYTITTNIKKSKFEQKEYKFILKEQHVNFMRKHKTPIFHPCGDLAQPILPRLDSFVEPRARIDRDLKFLGIGGSIALDMKRLALVQAGSLGNNRGSLPNESTFIEACLSGQGGLPTNHDDLESLFEGWVLCSDNRIYHPKLCALIAESFNIAALADLISRAAFGEGESGGLLRTEVLVLAKGHHGEAFELREVYIQRSQLAGLHRENIFSRPSHTWAPRLISETNKCTPGKRDPKGESIVEDENPVRWSQEALGAEPVPKPKLPASLLPKGAVGSLGSPMCAQQFRSVVPFFSTNPISKINSSWKTISMAYPGGVTLLEIDLSYRFCLLKKGETLNLAYFTKLAVELAPSVKSLASVCWLEIDVRSSLLNMNNRSSQQLINALSKVVSEDQREYVDCRLKSAMALKGRERDKKMFDLLSDIERFQVVHSVEGVDVLASRESCDRFDVYGLM